MEPTHALKDAEKAISLDPKFVKGWIRKGICHQMTKEYHKALKAFEEGLKIDPDNNDCKENLYKTR